MSTVGASSRIVALLGPTNTGKTHHAIERMLGHRSGMIGFPLRLLARENYDRVVARVGAARVALVTGEEKILPPEPRYYLCTVESMPVGRPVEFLAIDEIQLAADPDRGHVFTDRLLAARGISETMFLGAETARSTIRRLVPDAIFENRPRFSRLVYSGAAKVARLPRRSAVVAFSAAEVYELAEAVRRQRGGAAVVMGALSPRARNAQVGMFQSGEVDFLVATDAIGMGLNMDLEHVALAALAKFDGHRVRHLTTAEIGQIAGRAGRHVSDGTFGTTHGVGLLQPELIEAIEEHRFEPISKLFWRNRHLDFRSLKALIGSLEQRTDSPWLMRKRDAADHLALKALMRREDIADRAAGHESVQLLWQVCQIPDFRRAMAEAHAGFLGRVFLMLQEKGRLADDWIAKAFDRMDRTEGEIETLMDRIAHIRTWTYIANRSDWVDDSAGLREQARTIEDRLSDALHERLTSRFVDRRSAVLSRRLGSGEELMGLVEPDGTVLVEDHPVGRLSGLAFEPPGGGKPGMLVRRSQPRPVESAIRRVVPREIGRRVAALGKAGDDAFFLDERGRLFWAGEPVARLVPGPGVLRPHVQPLPNDLMTPSVAGQLTERLGRWVDAEISRRLGRLADIDDTDLPGPVRGIVYRLREGLGCCPRHEASGLLGSLDETGRKTLARLGIRLGRETVFLPSLLKPAAIRLRGILWSVATGNALPELPPAGRVSMPMDPEWPPGYVLAIGFLPLGARALRVDMAERLAAVIRRAARKAPFEATPEMLSLAAVPPGELASVLSALGYRTVKTDDGLRFAPRQQSRRGQPRRGKPRQDSLEKGARPDSPFAALGTLAIARDEDARGGKRNSRRAPGGAD